MGTYEKFMKDRAMGLDRSSGTFDDRVNAAMDADEAFAAAKGRLDAFVGAYLAQPGLKVDVHRLVSVGPDYAHQEHLLLDDLRIILDGAL
jgi:hypothetical protein